eukprot:1167735-Prorocentrum_minimum.AAC.3
MHLKTNKQIIRVKITKRVVRESILNLEFSSHIRRQEDADFIRAPRHPSMSPSIGFQLIVEFSYSDINSNADVAVTSALTVHMRYINQSEIDTCPLGPMCTRSTVQSSPTKTVAIRALMKLLTHSSSLLAHLLKTRVGRYCCRRSLRYFFLRTNLFIHLACRRNRRHRPALFSSMRDRSALAPRAPARHCSAPPTVATNNNLLPSTPNTSKSPPLCSTLDGTPLAGSPTPPLVDDPSRPSRLLVQLNTSCTHSPPESTLPTSFPSKYNLTPSKCPAHVSTSAHACFGSSPLACCAPGGVGQRLEGAAPRAPVPHRWRKGVQGICSIVA